MVFFILFTTFLTACSEQTTTVSPSQTEEMKIAVLPILETLPLYIADQEGYFEEAGLEVEFIPVASGAERDQVISSGQADAMINEVISTMFFNREESRLSIVRYARTATETHPLFRIMASAQSQLTNTEDLDGVDIGISEGTVIEYVTDRLLEKAGIQEQEIEYVAIPKIPDRMALLGSGEIQAAVLPEPLSSLAEQNGAISVLDDTTYPEVSFSTISFRNEYLQNHPNTVKGFLKAVEMAVDDINSEPQRWKPVLVENNLLPEPLIESFEIPPFATAGIPTQTQWEDVLQWALEKGLLDTEVEYQTSVTPEYLP
jgi:NitT/TauT family transport system substrate-binding protein